MKTFWIAIPLAASLTCGASAVYDGPPADATASIAAVQQAPDPATAADAYGRGLELGADRVLLNRSYVHRMIELGVPGQAEAAAEELVEADPQDGVAWAVLAYCDAARNDTTAALAELATAIDQAPQDPFVLGVAGKLMAWYRYPGLGDPRELPAELAERLDQIHAEFSSNEHYSAAFLAAFEFYASQADLPIPERPEALVELPFDNVVYDPVRCPTYTEVIYSGFAVPCFSYWYVVPRVRTYVVCERRVHRHLRFHIADRCDRYRGPVHIRRLAFERGTRFAAFHLDVRVRLAPPRGVTLPPPRPRYARTAHHPHAVSLRFGPTRPPRPAPRLAATHHPPPRGPGAPHRPGAARPHSPRWDVSGRHAPGSPGIVPPRSQRPQSAPQVQPGPRSRSEVRPPARSDGRPHARSQATTPEPRFQPPPRPRSEARPRVRPEGRPQTGPPPRQPAARPQPTPRPRPDARPQVRPDARPPAGPPPRQPAARPQPTPRLRPEARRPQAGATAPRPSAAGSQGDGKRPR